MSKPIIKLNTANHRYQVSLDGGKTWEFKRGVTSILGAVLAKPALMMWPMDEALKYLFGQKFEEQLQDDGSIIVKPLYDEAKAELATEHRYTPTELQRLLEAARAAHTIKRDRGGDTGHVVHEAIEAYLTSGVAPSLTGEASKAFEAFVRWYKAQEDIKVIETELEVYSQTLDYCGTLDLLAEINGKKVIVDIKTSNYSRTAPLGIYPENFLQLGAYAYAYDEEPTRATEIHDLLIVNASKQGKINTRYASELGFSVDKCISAFADVWETYQTLEELKKGLKK